MSLKRFQQPVKTIELGKFDKGGTSIMRKASDIRLTFSDASDIYGGMGMGAAANSDRPIGSAVINLNVLQFFVGENDANGKPTYGEQLSGNGLTPSYPVSIQAVGNDFVQVVYADAEKTQLDLTHPDCGKFLTVASAANPKNYEEGGLLHGIDYMYDNEFFRQVAYQNYIVVMPLLEAFILSYAQRGGFDLK